MSRLALVPLVLSWMLGCEDAAPPPAEEAAPSCDLTVDNLVGPSFVYTKKDASGKWAPENKARLTFVQDASGLKAKYSVHSLTSVYSYSCSKKKATELECWQDKPDLVEFCRALWANTGSCAADTLAQVTQVAADDADLKAAVERVNAEIKKLPAADAEDLKTRYGSNESMQLRGLIRVRVKAAEEECRLSVDDMFQNFSHGQARELENLVGRGARFVKTDQKMVFEDCRDVNHFLVASDKAEAKPGPGEMYQDGWSSGASVHFKYVGPDAGKTEAGCTYSQDAWLDYLPVQQAAPVEGGQFGFNRSVTGAGWHAAHLYRYKACNGGAPELIDVSCTGIKAE